MKDNQVQQPEINTVIILELDDKDTKTPRPKQRDQLQEVPLAQEKPEINLLVMVKSSTNPHVKLVK